MSINIYSDIVQQDPQSPSKLLLSQKAKQSATHPSIYSLHIHFLEGISSFHISLSFHLPHLVFQHHPPTIVCKSIKANKFRDKANSAIQKCIPQNYLETQSPISRRQRQLQTLSRTLPNELTNETHQLRSLK